MKFSKRAASVGGSATLEVLKAAVAMREPALATVRSARLGPLSHLWPQ